MNFFAHTAILKACVDPIDCECVDALLRDCCLSLAAYPVDVEDDGLVRTKSMDLHASAMIHFRNELENRCQRWELPWD